ncbi:MAG: gliding motility-associated C-terminal domain-containing protein [Bacteroidetes bacterium]|nr:gliding motility-associated C-terminal domain-containing protein [Bacteroidota bacterium]
MAEHLRALGTLVRHISDGTTTLRTLFRKSLIVASALLLWQADARATHAMGGDLSYSCLGNGRYLVTLSFYRDCNGVAAPTNCNNGLEFRVQSSQCGANFTQCFGNNPTVQVITPICPSEADRCNSASGTYGVEKYTYTKVIDLSAYAACGGTDWNISWSLCCRNNAITSLNNPGDQDLYLSARLNNTAGLCNSSPVFTNPPTPFYCLGQSISYNPGATDANGDSLAYALIAARGANGVNLNYSNNYSATQPIRNTGGANAVTLDPITGTMTVTPSVQQVAVVTYRVREYRNGVLVGEVTRDIQFVIRACSGNSSPTATGINGTNTYSTQVCAGTPVSFTINSSDPNAGQIVTMTWNGGIPGATFTTAGSPFPTGTFTWTPTVANIGNNVFTVHVADNGCPLTSSNDFGYSITVTPPATNADAGPDQSVCATSATLAGVLPYAGLQGTWTLVSGAGTITTPGSPTSTVTGLGLGANVFRWTVNYQTCGTRSDDVTITRYDPAQAAANAGPDQTKCLPTTTATLAGNTAAAPATGTWTLVSGTGTITTPNSPTSGVTGLGLGANRFRWTIDNGPCGAPTQDEVIITVFSNLQGAANAGPDIAICTPASSVTMNGNALVGPATGQWTLVSGAGTITTPGSPTTTITGLPVGVHVFQWTVNNGPCTNPITSDQVTVTVFSAASPSADAGPDQQVCSPSNATLAGSTPVFPATGVWTLVSGSGTITNPNSPTSTVTGLGIGINVFQWTVNNGPCANGVTSDQVSITSFDPTISGSNAGPDQSLCTPTTTATMAGSATTAPAVGTWTLVSGSGTITNPNSATTTITGLAVGENVFRWSVSNGPCPLNPPSDVVSIFVYSATAPAANAGPDQQLCTPTSSATLAGNAPTFPATGQWTLVSGSGTITTPGSPTSTVTGLAVGTNVFQWTVNNGPCANPITSDQVSIVVFNAANPVANAGPDQDLCTPNTSTALAGSSIIAPATGTWTLVSGTGTIVSPNSPTSQVTGLGVGDNIFRWSVSNGPCAGGLTTDDVRIRVFNASNPVANAGPDQQLCSNAPSATMAGSSIIAPATGTWTLVSGAGTITNPNSPTTTITGLAVGENVFRWTVLNGPCANGNTNDLVSLFVFSNTHPAVTVGPDQNICVPTVPNSVTLTGSTPVFPATGTWTLVSGSGTITSPNSPTTGITGLNVGVNVFRWTITNGPCTFPGNSANVTVRVYDASMPLANAGPDQSLCTPITSTSLAGSAVIAPATGQWTVISGTGTFANASSPTTTVSGLSLGNNVFQWRVDNGPCGIPTTDQVTISLFNGSAQASNAGPDQQLCDNANSTTLAANAVTLPATGSWSVVQGTATFGNANSPTSTVNNLGVGVNILAWSVNNGACGTSTDQVSITVYDDANPIAAAGPDQDLCTPTTSATLAGSSVIAPAVGTWTLISGTGNIVSPNSPNTQVTGLGIGNNVFRWTVDNGPCPNGTTSDDVTIVLFSGSAQASNAGPDQQLCTPTTSATLAGNAAVAPAVGTWTVIAGTGTFVNANAANTVVNGLSVGTNTFAWTINNGSCGTTTDQVTILVFNAANPNADAGQDQQLCTPTTTATMAGSSLIFPATGTWTLVSGTGTITTPGSPTTTITGLSIGVNTFRWTVSNGPCANATTSDEVSVTVFDQTVSGSNAGPDQRLCTPTNTATMAANAPAFPAMGTWTLVSGAGTITNANSATTTVTGLAIGENVFRWSLSNGPCPLNPPNDLVSIFVFDANNPPANAGPDQQLCTPTTATTLAGSPLTFPATGTWTLVQGTGTIANAGSPTSTVSGLSVGENIFEWTVNNGPCANPVTTDRVSIFVFDANNPNANAGPDQSLCTPTVTATLAGNTPTFPATGTWTLVQGTGTFTNAADPATTVSGLSVGENIFRWTVNNGPCANGVTSDLVSIFLFDANNPNANAGPDQQLCTPTTATTLAGSAVTFPATGTWTLVSGTGTITTPGSPTSGVTGLSVGANVFRWTVSNGLCVGGTTSDEVTIFLFDANNPVAVAGPDQDLCTPASTAVMAGSNVIFPATGTWSVASGSATIVDPANPATTISDLPVGTHLLVWTVSNGPCADALTTDTVRIRVFDRSNPVAAAGPDVELCTPTTSHVLAGSSVISPAVGTWTVVQGAGTFANANDPLTTVSNLGVGVNILRWTVDNGPCESGTSFDEVTITLFDGANPLANAGPDQELCTPTTSTTLAGSAIIAPAVGTWTLVSGTGVIADANDPNSAVSGLSIGANVFRWSVSNGPCADPLTTDEVSIFVFDGTLPTADAGNDQQVCTPLTGATLAGSPIVFPATGTWTLVSGQGTITDPSDPASTVTGLGIGENIFEWTVDNGPCGAGITTDQVSIFLFDLNAPPAAAGADQSFCTPVSSTTLAGNATTGAAIGVWTVAQGTGSFTDPNDPGTDVTGLTVGENILTWTIDNGVCGISHDNVSIFIFDANNPAANAGADQEYCVPQDSTLLAGNAPIFPAQGTWSVIDGAGLFVDVHDPLTKVVGLAIGANTFVWTMDNGPCPNAITTDTITVTLFSDSTHAANAGEDIEICAPLSTTQLHAEVPQLPATGSWSILSGSGVITDPGSPTSGLTGLTVGITTLVWTLDNGPCPNNGLLTDTVLVTVYNPFGLPANAGPDQELCTPDDNTTMAGSIPDFPGYGTWTLVSGTGTIADIHDPATAITGLTIGENVFEWLVYYGDCGFGPPSRDTVVVSVFDAGAPPAAAGEDQAFCTPNTSTTLAANSATFPGEGTWTLISGTATIASPNDPATAVSSIAVGDNVFVWTIDNGACGTTTDTLHILIYNDDAPDADAGLDKELCSETSTTLSANAPEFPATASWSVITGPGAVTAPNDPTSAVTGLGAGINVFRWTIDNGPCGTTSDDVTIVVFDGTLAPPDAGPDQALCGATSAILAASGVEAPATGSWSILSGPGTLSDPSSPTATLTGLTPGETVLVWTIDNGPCPTALSDTVQVTIYGNTQQPADAGPDQQLCEPGATSVDMFANEVASPATGLWTVASGSGTIADPTDRNTVITGVGFGTSVFVWTIDNGVCGTSSDEVAVSVFDANVPPADGGPDQDYCQDTTSTQMHAVPATSTASGVWSLLSGSGDITSPGSATSSITGLRPGDNVFVWTINNGACGSTGDSVVVMLIDCSTLVVPDAFSPNRDGVNDTYVIRGLEYYPDNTLQVFNRWGSKVLDRSPYTNNWDGRSEGSMNWGEDLPESTYYFILDPGNDKEVITGYIYLRR